MSDNCCCTASGKKAHCPACGNECIEVSLQTMLHHLNAPWTCSPAPVQHYFCSNRDCEITYFDHQGNLYNRGMLRPETRTALSGDLICFCYGIDAATAKSESEAKEFVITQTRGKACACESRNPSGRCCLKDFPQ